MGNYQASFFLPLRRLAAFEPPSLTARSNVALGSLPSKRANRLDPADSSLAKGQFGRLRYPLLLAISALVLLLA
jgi:hypothetical protein